MSRYSAIKAATNAYIKTNGRQEITGAILNAVMIATIDSLGKFYQFVGNAVPDTDPGVIDQNIAYLASTPGAYEKLGGLSVAAGEVAVLKFDGEWHKEVVIVIPSKVSDLVNDLGFITNAVSDLVNYYTKSEVYKKSETYDKEEIDSLFDAITRQSYIVAWDGTAEPVVADIPAGVVVTYNATPYTGTLAPSASTAGKIYLVSNGVGFDMYVTSDNSGYSWVMIGTSSLDLTGYVTTADLLAVEDETYVHRTSVDEALYRVRATTSTSYSHNVDGSSTGTRIRIIFFVRKGEILKYSTSLASGIVGGIYSNIPDAVNSGATGRLQQINANYTTNPTTATANQDGFLSLSLTNGDTPITDAREQEMLDSVTLDLAYPVSKDEKELKEYVKDSNGYIVTSANEALYIYKKVTSSETVTDDASGKRLRIVFPVKVGDFLRFTCTDVNGYFAGVWNSVRKCMQSTPTDGLVQEITPGNTYVNTPLALEIKSDGYLCISLTNGNSAITDTRKSQMLASISIMLGGRANDYTGKELVILRDEVNGGSVSSYNKDMDDALVSVGGVNAYASGNYDNPVAKKANLSILAITDIHGTFDSISRAVDFANKKMDYIDYVACLGDVVLRSPADSVSDFESSFADCTRPFLFVVGNHDTADTNLAGITEAQARTKYFSQIESNGWITDFKDSTSCSWYKDDSTHKIRIISVFEYGNSQEIATGAPNTYCRRWIPSDTMQWFADTLYSTPSNYSVVVLLHQIPYFPATYVEGKFTISSDMRISLSQFFLNTIDGNPFGDIVDAFINGTEISRTYNSISSYGLGKTASVAKDFSERGEGKFICFVTGHFHGSYIFTDATYPEQKTIVVPSGSRSVYQQKYGDTNYAPNNRHEDQFYVLGFDTDKKLINIAKIGGQVTNDMVKRDIISIKY